ncbi:MBL fold metallo-hydrolase [Cellulomonas fimi]|uniref:MBL fold metallo-hydrolase n=1 Tax=Cellulomonas fimi TaxID=1708 RepID=A0A7Y0M120_CELFI|nr:MBL fold metallo-hydrolase [Cellulomonas fimi]NMR21545.1 MBL fold metallo-hydrolase [Cellulomonas fimi]
MELTRLGHACVRLERDGARLVIDPGVWSAPDAAEGADAVLVTHEHVDHVDVGRLREALDARSALEVWAPQPVVDALCADAEHLRARVHAAAHGDVLDAGGFEVEVFGETHALVHPDLPRIANVAYLVGGVLHPGDSFTEPGRPVEVLLLPVAAPWLRLADAVDYARAVAARRVVPIHDAMLSDVGVGVVDRLLGPKALGAGGAEYVRPVDGEPLTVS